ANVTYIGRGAGASNRALTIRDNAGGYFYNNVFVNFDRGVDVEKLQSGSDSYAMFQSGLLDFRNNVFHNVGTDWNSTDLSTVFEVTGGSDEENNILVDAVTNRGNVVAYPGV